ncbi:hypothetical protein RclHR1_03190020 [Rhizophagus clarus]|uniref:E3 ubiquitin-protein ligase makorin n=1 Tax=Rhizophagus clarus TaxID=94130 RepID=A0A2Z6S2R1_9GLOM|nr:hypothetical protein RclHR1_03190020 [Rhizophagus clarus]GES88728.1 E3 ubiquitin-protein ligase makorin [Rhizophagus clarus]
MQASSLPNPPSILAQLYPRQLESNNLLNIPSIVTSPSIPSSVSESFLFNYQPEQLNSPISQAISAPVTPTSSVTPGFSQPPRRGKGNQNGSNSTSNDVKSNGSKSNSNLAHIPCKFFKSGACTAGKNCVFSHSKDPPSDNYVCKYFLKGNCKFGSKCALSHTLPNERKLSSNGRNGNNKNANGSRNSISNSVIPEIRSPIMIPQDLNDFQPLNSPGIPPFARIPISPSEYANNRQFSQLTASLNDPSAYSDENHTAPRLRNINTNFNNDHLTAPININGQQRRSLPDIFHLGGPLNNNSSNNNHNNHNHNNTAESFGTSPFHNPGSKSIFLPLSYVSDSGMLSPTANSHQHLHSIPELHDYSHDTVFDDFGAYEYEEFIPSSLNDLLTPTERERRRSRQEESSELSPRRLFSGSSMLHPLHIDGQHLNCYNSHVDPTHIHFAGRSLPHGIGVGLAANYMNQNDQQTNNAYGGHHPFGFPSGTSMRNNPTYDDWDPHSPLSPLHPIHNHAYSGTPAINIPFPHEVHQTDLNSPLYSKFGTIGQQKVNNINVNGNYNGNGRTTPSDPFSPFPDDDIFKMEEDREDKYEQMSVEASTPKSSEQPKTPLSYSAITKTGLKDSGATPGLSIDSRRYEPLCPFGVAGNCRYGDHCHFLHGMPCPSCLKHVLHPYHSPEEHQEHINECINKQVQVADGVKPEDLECEICFEKVLSKADARFGLLNCEHAFCLHCIRQLRSTDNQFSRACPVCRTPSHFITPSTTWITDRAEKQRVINEYKRKCSTIPCRNFNHGEGQCQFGASCFYAHTYRDGTKEETNVRTIQNGEEVRVLDNVRLWDFMEDFGNKRTTAENLTNQPDNDNNSEVLNGENNTGKNKNDETDTNDYADTPTVTLTTMMSNLSVDSPVFIPSVNGVNGTADL